MLVDIGSNKPCLIIVLIQGILHSLVNKALGTPLVLDVISFKFIFGFLNLLLSFFGSLLQFLFSHLGV